MEGPEVVTKFFRDQKLTKNFIATKIL